MLLAVHFSGDGSVNVAVCWSVVAVLRLEEHDLSGRIISRGEAAPRGHLRGWYSAAFFVGALLGATTPLVLLQDPTVAVRWVAGIIVLPLAFLVVKVTPAAPETSWG